MLQHIIRIGVEAQNWTVLDFMHAVKTLAGRSSRENELLAYVAKHPFSYQVRLNGERLNPFFGIDLVEAVTKCLERSNNAALDISYDEAVNAYCWYENHLNYWCLCGKEDKVLSTIDSMLSDRKLLKRDIVKIMDVAISLFQPR